MLLLLIALTLTGAFALGGLYVADQVTAPGRIARQRLQTRQDTRQGGTSALRSNRSSVPMVHLLPLSATARERIQLDLHRAGMRMQVNEFLAIKLGVGVGVAFVSALVAASFVAVTGFILIAGAVGLLIGWVLPGFHVSRRTRKRRLQIEHQLPEALMAIAKSLRAGSGFLHALAFAAGETRDPLGGELQAVLRDLQLGAEAEEVFGDLGRRVGSKDLDIVVTAILIQRSAGGNLAEILSNVTKTIRERVKLQGEIRTLTSRQKLMGNIIAFVPVIVVILMLLINPEMGNLLINTGVGRIALGAGIGFELLGLFLIRRLAVIEV